MMPFPNREDRIKRPNEGLSNGKGVKVAHSISASEVSGNASCEVREGRSTDDGENSITLSEERALAAHKSVQDGGELHSAVSMYGGTRIKRLEPFLNGLYQCAKADRQRVFHSLHDKLCSMDTLTEAWRRVAANNGASGIDSETIEDVRNSGVEQYLSTLQHELINETYEAECVRRVYIPKPNGKQRPLGIPTVRDRIVQQAVKLLIEPIFEADFQPFSYGYRPSGRCLPLGLGMYTLRTHSTLYVSFMSSCCSADRYCSAPLFLMSSIVSLSIPGAPLFDATLFHASVKTSMLHSLSCSEWNTLCLSALAHW